MKKRKVKALSHSYNNDVLAEIVTAWIKDHNVEVIKLHFITIPLNEQLGGVSMMHYAYIEYYEIEE